MAEDFGVAGPGQLLRPGRGAPRRRAEPPAPAHRAVRGRAADVADADGLRDKRVEVFRAIPPADPAHYVRGQYDGYLAVPGVSPGSATETFAALRLEIDNWRWAGVPFFIRAGKAPAGARHRDTGHLQAAAQAGVRADVRAGPGRAHPRIDPNPGVDLVVQAKQPGAQATRTVDLSLVFAEELGEAPQPYERLLGDALHGGLQPVHPGRQRGGDVAHRAAPAGRAAPGGALPARILGPGQRRQTARRPPELARPTAALARHAPGRPSAAWHAGQGSLICSNAVRAVLRSYLPALPAWRRVSHCLFDQKILHLLPHGMETQARCAEPGSKTRSIRWLPPQVNHQTAP